MLRIRLRLTIVVISFIRAHIRKEENMIMMSIKRIILSLPKEVVTVVDLGYLGVEKDFPEQLSALPFKRKRNQDLTPEEKEYRQNSF